MIFCCICLGVIFFPGELYTQWPIVIIMVYFVSRKIICSDLLCAPVLFDLP